MTWPATRLAKSRTASEKGRIRKTDTNSMIPTSGFSPVGTPGGHTMWPT